MLELHVVKIDEKITIFVGIESFIWNSHFSILASKSRLGILELQGWRMG